jgi:hypothetical protein
VRDEAKEIADEYEQKTVSVETIIAPVEKSGRKISNANAALLQKAMDHHASATQCIKDVLGSNAADDPDGDDDKDPDGDAARKLWFFPRANSASQRRKRSESPQNSKS